MKKLSMLAAILGLAAVAACGATAKLTAPKAGEPWALGTTQTISWTWSGSAKVKLVLDSKSLGKLGNIKTDLDLGAGSCPWQVGALEKGKSAPAGADYSIRIVDTAEGKELDTSPVFAITGGGQPPPMIKVVPFEGFIITPLDQSIKFAEPRKDTVWIPLKNYAVKWSWTTPMDQSGCGYNPSCSGGCFIDVWLVPATATAAAQKTQLAKKVCCPSRVSKGIVTFDGECSGIVPPLASGAYFVRAEYSNNPSIHGDSQTFAVQSTLSPDTGYLDPYEPQHVDLAVTNISFNKGGGVSVWVKNQGGFFSDQVTVKYDISYIGNWAATVKKGDNSYKLTAKGGEELQLNLPWNDGPFFSGIGGDEGKFIPVTSRPILVKAEISTNFDVNYANNMMTKEICLLKDPDIGTDGEIKLIFSPKAWLSITRGTTNTTHEAKIKWLSQDTFEAELEVELWNYGAKAKTFDCWLWADQLPGQIVEKGITLQPGCKILWKKTVKVKLQSRCGTHQLVFIADPNEHKDEPYPNSYQNNFINVGLKIECGGTVEASSSQGSKKK